MYRVVLQKLRELTDKYGEILSVAEEKQLLLKNNDAKALIALNERESALSKQVTELERERLVTVDAILKSEGGGNALEITVSDLAERCKSSDKQLSKQLLDQAAALIAVITKLRETNAMNRELLEINLSFTAFMLESFSSGEGTGTVYGHNGCEQDYDGSGPSLFDSKI